jgi:hypothetical protein
MKQGYMIVLTKFSGPGLIFVNEVAFSVKQPKIDNLTSGDLFLTSDLIGVIDFCSCLINTLVNKCTNASAQRRAVAFVYARAHILFTLQRSVFLKSRQQ